RPPPGRERKCEVGLSVAPEAYPMSVSIACPRCNALAVVSPKMLGKRLRCAACRRIFVPEGPSALATAVAVAMPAALLIGGPHGAVVAGGFAIVAVLQAEPPPAPTYLDIPAGSDHGDVRVFITYAYRDENLGVVAGVKNMNPERKIDFTAWSE